MKLTVKQLYNILSEVYTVDVKLPDSDLDLGYPGVHYIGYSNNYHISKTRKNEDDPPILHNEVSQIHVENLTGDILLDRVNHTVSVCIDEESFTFTFLIIAPSRTLVELAQ
jgi:hypothetical protein